MRDTSIRARVMIDAGGRMEKTYEQKLKTRVERECFGLCLKLVTPGFTGIPDRLILLPIGRVVFVETKDTGKKERKRQDYVHGLLRKFGFTVFSTVNSMERVNEVVVHCKLLLESVGFRREVHPS